MSELRPCTSCDRHVAIDEATCPFCAAALAPAAPRPRPRGRLSRAALFASATLATAAACGGGKAKPVESTGAGGDTSGPAAVDAGIDAAEAREIEQDPDLQDPRRRRRDGPPNMPYGAPPARRRVV